MRVLCDFLNKDFICSLNNCDFSVLTVLEKSYFFFSVDLWCWTAVEEYLQISIMSPMSC